jgi:hypothetical protein
MQTSSRKDEKVTSQQSTQQVKQELPPAEETITITVKEYNDLKAKAQVTEAEEERTKEILSISRASEGREKRQLKRQRKMIMALLRLSKPGWYASVAATPIGDFLFDGLKEIWKNVISEETFEAWGKIIRSELAWFLGPIWGYILAPVGKWLISLPEPVKAATFMLVAAWLILNHAAKVSRPFRRGLVKFRSLFASKK